MAAAALLCASAAHAQSLPRFDVDAQCRKIANFGGSYSEMMMSGCLDNEQSSYDALKAAWGDLPEAMRKQCVKIATFGGPGSYMMLKGCVDNELAAARSNASRSFKY